MTQHFDFRDHLGKRRWKKPRAFGLSLREMVIGGCAMAATAGLVFILPAQADGQNGLHPTSVSHNVQADATARQFGKCHSGGGTNCVVDGDTFWMDGEKIRIADIDTPETHPSRCAEEKRLGNAATNRLQALLNAGAFELTSIDRDTDRYGRKLRIVERNGRSLGDVLVSEGLARPYGGGPRAGWCA